MGAVERVQLSRQKGWRKPDNTVVVSRPSRWGNPFPVSDWGLDLSIALFRNTARGMWIPDTLGQEKTDEQFALAYQQHNGWATRLGYYHPLEAIRAELPGKNLACWCPLDQPCHADVLLELANGRAS